MKKTLSLIMTTIMALSATGLTAVAAEKQDGTADAPINALTNYAENDVLVTYTDDDTAIVYHVEVEWESLEFEYEFQSATWNPLNHSYSDVTGEWTSETEAEITAINHSNADVTVSFAYEQIDTGVTGTFDVTSETINTGVGLTYLTADSAVSTFTIGGTPTASSAAAGVQFTAGTIKVTLES